MKSLIQTFVENAIRLLDYLLNHIERGSVVKLNTNYS